jgi:ABC-2 type transport system ATP-binding protein
MIEVEHLTKSYGRTLAVDDLSFTVAAGQVTGFLGPNGSGKSTTLRMIVGLDAPSSGRVTIAGHRYGEVRFPLHEVGALLDAHAVHPGRSARNHLVWLADSNQIPRSRVDEVIAMVGLTEVAHRRAGAFSLGMGQRLGIAAALLGDPEVLIFDEPINGLDPEGILWVRHLLRSLADAGRTVLVSSHLMSEMALTAQHLVVIGRGRILADTGMADFIGSNSENYVRVRTPQPDALGPLLTGHGWVVKVEDDGAFRVHGASSVQIGDVAGDAGVRLHELAPVQASLEEAFMQLTGDSVEYHAGVPMGGGL